MKSIFDTEILFRSIGQAMACLELMRIDLQKESFIEKDKWRCDLLHEKLEIAYSILKEIKAESTSN